jgi:hypothetical protein
LKKAAVPVGVAGAPPLLWEEIIIKICLMQPKSEHQTIENTKSD